MSQPCSDKPFCDTVDVDETIQFCQTNAGKKFCPCLCDKPKEEISTVADGKYNLVFFTF